MRRIIVAIAFLGLFGSANALPNINGGTPIYHNDAYNAGYRAGKSHAYNNMAKGAVVVGIAVITGLAIYSIGKQKCENGLACVKF